MSLRVLHVLDHSIPLHSGYTFRTLAILREQRRVGWQTFHLTSPKHGSSGQAEELVDGLHFHRTLPAKAAARVPGLSQVALMRQLERRLMEVATRLRPQILHAHSPVLNAIPALRVGRRLGIPVVLPSGILGHQYESPAGLEAGGKAGQHAGLVRHVFEGADRHRGIEGCRLQRGFSEI